VTEKKGQQRIFILANRIATSLLVIGVIMWFYVDTKYGEKYCSGVDIGDIANKIFTILALISIVLYISYGAVNGRRKIKNNGYRNAAIVLVLLVIIFMLIGTPNTARDKAKDATIKSDISQLNAAQIFYADDNNGLYTSDCNKLAPKYISKCLTHPETGQPYTINVSNDGKSWYVETSLMQTVNEICTPSTSPQWYYRCGIIGQNGNYQCEEIKK